MSSVKKRLVLIILIFMHAQCMNPMRKLLLRDTTIGCTSFYYLVLSWPVISLCHFLAINNTEKYINQLESPTNREKKFVYEQLQKAGVLDPNQINIKIDLKFGYNASFFHRCVWINPYDPTPEEGLLSLISSFFFGDERLDTLLKKQSQISEWFFGTHKKDLKIKLHKALLQHEAAHLKNRDSTRNIVATGLIPLVSHAIARNAKVAFKKPTFVKQFLKIPGALGLYLFNCTIFHAYRRHQEFKADENIEQDLETLQVFKEFLQYIKTNQDTHMQDWSSLRKRLFHLFSNDHPWPAERIKRAEERIKKLENKIS